MSLLLRDDAHRRAREVARESPGDRGCAALLAEEAGAAGDPDRGLRGDRRLRAGARHEHGDEPAERPAVLAPLRPHHPDARQHHEEPRSLRQRGEAVVAATWPGCAAGSAVTAAAAASIARSGTRSAITRHRPHARRSRARPALRSSADLVEEMKSDLVSLFAMQKLADRGLASPNASRRCAPAGSCAS